MENKADGKEMEILLSEVYEALCEKGYDPARQIAGYILSEDPLYMPDFNNARGLISHVDRDEFLKLIVEYYLVNRFSDKTLKKTVFSTNTPVSKSSMTFRCRNI